MTEKELPEESGYKLPEVNELTVDDLRSALSSGFADFRKAPLFGLFFAAFYVVGGLIIVQSLFVWDQSWMIYPVAIGFPIIGPFAAVGLYDVSRRLQTGAPLNWSEILNVVRSQSGKELSWMAFVVLFVFWIWMYQIRLLIAIVLGRMSFSGLDGFLSVVFNTQQGWAFLAIGHVVGAVLSLILFSITVVSIPMLLDRDIDFISAMITSVKAVFASPVVMLGWGVVVTLSVIAAMIPAFLGLFLVLPVLGHTTWHIYQKAVA